MIFQKNPRPGKIFQEIWPGTRLGRAEAGRLPTRSNGRAFEFLKKLLIIEPIAKHGFLFQIKEGKIFTPGHTEQFK